MALLPIEHTRRLVSPAEAEAFYRGLGCKRVSARGFHTTDTERMRHVVDAVDPKREHTISFEGGALGPAARNALDALAVSAYEYLDVRAVDEDLRIWPSLPRIWVHTARDLEAARASLGPDAHEVTIDQRTMETKSIPIGVRLFQSLAPDQFSRGFVKGLKEETKAPLLRFLEALRPRVDAVLDLEIGSARALTETYAGEKLDWQAEMILVDFPEGKLHGYLTSSACSPSDREKWQERVTKALKKGGLL